MPASTPSTTYRSARGPTYGLTDIPPEVFAKRIFPRLVPGDQFEPLLETSRATRRYVLSAAASIAHAFSSALVLCLEAGERPMKPSREAQVVRRAATRLLDRHAIATPTLAPWIAAQPDRYNARLIADVIHHAWLTGTSELDLTGGDPTRMRYNDEDINSLPEEIDMLTTVTHLKTFSILVIGVPSQIFRMTWLKELDLRSLHLFELPDALASLSRLESLKLEHNRFWRVPPVVLELGALKWLVIERAIVNASEPLVAKTLADRKIRCLQTSFFQLAAVNGGYGELANYNPWPPHR